MSISILATKLYTPELRQNFVPRPHLIERLSNGFQSKLTLVSAPAGYGKSTLVSEWVAQRGHPSAWLTLDERDNDLDRFLAYLIAALQTVASKQAVPHSSEKEFGVEVLALLNSPPPSLIEPVLTALLNEITTLPEPFTVVLDGYHVIRLEQNHTETLVDNAMTFLLTHMPPQMHVVMISREQPRLPLSRLRALGQLTELQTADLQFLPEEMKSFFRHTVGIEISAKQLADLEGLTKGWVAVLQLVAIALRGKRDISLDVGDLVQSLNGSHTYILDYLVEEILHQQPEHLQKFLLHTSVLKQLNGPLCDALINPEEGATGQQSLATLLGSNLLVTQLDDQHQWYRYHDLFADALRAQLRRKQPDLEFRLHRKAAAWYLAHDFLDKAIDHALAAQDFEFAAGLIEQIWSTIRRSCFRSPSWLGWVNVLPYEIVRVRPVLSVGYAWELLNFGELDAANRALDDAEQWLGYLQKSGDLSQSLPDEMVIVNKAESLSLPAMLANTRAFHAQARGNMIETALHAQLALTLAPADDHFTRGLAASFVGLASWANGELETAFDTIADGMASLKRAGNVLFVLNDTFFQLEIRMAQGRLREALAICNRALHHVDRRQQSALQGVARLYVGIALLKLEMGQFQSAEQALRQSAEVGAFAALPDWPFRHRLAQAQLHFANGEIDDGFTRLDEAERLFVHPPAPLFQPIHAVRARIWIRQGKLNAARQWAQEYQLSPDDPPHYIREFEQITMARLLLAEVRADQDSATGATLEALLDRLLDLTEVQNRTKSMIELLILQALTFQTLKYQDAALTPLQHALKLAEPEPFIRVFVEEGAPMLQLLTRSRSIVVEDHRAKAFVEKLITYLNRLLRRPALAEPLTPRELDVIQLIATGLSNPQIAAELVIGLTTVKTHVKNIYGKLQVSNRVAAVARANELNLL